MMFGAGIGVDYHPGSGDLGSGQRLAFVPPEELAMPGCSTRLQGTVPSRAIAGEVMLGMENEYSDPFKKMIGHPSIVQRFNWMVVSSPPPPPPPFFSPRPATDASL